MVLEDRGLGFQLLLGSGEYTEVGGGWCSNC